MTNDRLAGARPIGHWYLVIGHSIIMHGHVSYDVFLHQIAGFLGSYYLLLSLMNGVAAFLLWQRPNQPAVFLVPVARTPVTAAFVWLMVSLLFLLIAPLAYSGDPDIVKFISVPSGLRATINRL